MATAIALLSDIAKISEHCWASINAFPAGRLLCAGCITFPLFNKKVLEKLSARLIDPVLARAKRALKSRGEKELLLFRVHMQQFLRVILIYMIVLYVGFPGPLGELILLMVRSGLVVVIFMGINIVLRPILWAIPVVKRFAEVTTIEWIIRVCRVFLGSICIVTILEWWGIHVAAFLTGLGFLGAAVVLGAQDLFKNLISGFLILAEKRFNHGDWVHVDDVVEGYVEAIGFRSTLLKRTDGAPIYVPNARLADVAVVNFSGINFRRVYWRVSLDPNISFHALKTVRMRFDQTISELPKAPPRPDTSIFVYVDALTETSVDIILSCFLPALSLQEFLQGREAFAQQLADIVKEAGTRFVLPRFALSSHATTGLVPEIFVPPLEPAPIRKSKNGAPGRSRTSTSSRTTDFESAASTNSATEAPPKP